MPLAWLLVAALAAASPLSAQGDAGSRVHVGVIGGLSYPGGNLKSNADRGWNAGALLSIGTPHGPLSVRIEGQWNQFNSKPLFDGGDRPAEYDDLRVIDATANAVYTFPSSSIANVYLIAGGGFYTERGTVRLGYSSNSPISSTSATATNLGVNGGAGIRLRIGRRATFAELRYHYLPHGAEVLPYGYLGSGHEALHYWPLTVGIMF